MALHHPPLRLVVCFFFRLLLPSSHSVLHYRFQPTGHGNEAIAVYQWGPRCNSHVVGEKNSSVFYQKVPREAPNIQPRSAQGKRKNRENRESSRDSGEKVVRNIWVTIHHFSTVVFNKSFVLSLSLDLTPQKIGKSRYSILLRKFPVGRIWAGRIHVHQSSRWTPAGPQSPPLNISVGSWSHILVFSNSFSFSNAQKVGNCWVEQTRAIGSLHENLRSKTGRNF